LQALDNYFKLIIHDGGSHSLFACSSELHMMLVNC
jgi:hypothetical protein